MRTKTKSELFNKNGVFLREFDPDDLAVVKDTHLFDGYYGAWNYVVTVGIEYYEVWEGKLTLNMAPTAEEREAQ